MSNLVRGYKGQVGLFRVHGFWPFAVVFGDTVKRFHTLQAAEACFDDCVACCE